MQRPKRITLSPTASDPNGIALTQTPAAGGVQSLTLAGVLVSGGVATLGAPQHVDVSSTGADTARVFTITGTDVYDNVITETITGVNSNTVDGVKNFKTVTGVTVDDDTAGAITVGVAGTCESQWVPQDIYDDYNTSVAVAISGTLTCEVQATYDDIQAAGFEPSTATAIGHATLTALTASAAGSYTSPPMAIRLAISAFTSGSAELQIVSSGDGP
jgi:hypothetical protein